MDTYEDAIKDCTRSLEIQSAGHAAVSAYLTRGIAYDALRKADLALRDMGEAIALDSSNGFLFAVRGETYANAGHREEAAKDLAHAAQLNPGQAGLVLARGMFTAVGGGYADAIPDLTKAMQEEKPDPMAAIWLHIAKFHAGQNDAQQQIEQDYRKTDIRQWPGAVAALYAEKATTEDVKTQASSGDPSIWGEQKCEADFYLGEYALIKNDKEGATKSFRAAVDGCPQTVSNEKQSAAAELKALQPQLISQPPQNP
jgi:lipoprotein NlpI